MGSIVYTTARTMCYIMSSMTPFSRRGPCAVAKQMELLEKYHQNGVINGQTYQRLCYATMTNTSEKVKGPR